MATRNRSLHFAVTGALLALAPVGTCELAELGQPRLAADAGDDPNPQDTLRARDGGPTVNPGPVDDDSD